MIRKACYDIFPERTECPTPTAHGVMEVIKTKLHGSTWASHKVIKILSPMSLIKFIIDSRWINSPE
jgi:hypothetical protein